jgi:hypothetical protein
VSKSAGELTAVVSARTGQNPPVTPHAVQTSAIGTGGASSVARYVVPAMGASQTYAA